MNGNFKTKLKYHIGSIGYLIIIAGIIGGPVLIWWLSFRHDIIDVLHEVKMSLPGWAWIVMKYGFSLAFGLAFVLFFILLGMLILAWSKPPKRDPE